MSRSPSMAIRPRQDPNAPRHPTETYAAPQPPAPTTPPGKAATEQTPDPGGQPLLLEIGWETCNQLGGIYTVLRSKSPEMVRRWGDRYLLVGPYVTQLLPDHEEQGVFVTPRRHGAWDQSAQSLCDQMWSFCQQDHRQRVDQRNHVEAFSVNFDWRHLAERYQQAHELALDRVT